MALRLYFALYVAFMMAVVVGFLVWGICTPDANDRITALVVSGVNALQGGLCVFLNTGSRRY